MFDDFAVVKQFIFFHFVCNVNRQRLATLLQWNDGAASIEIGFCSPYDFIAPHIQQLDIVNDVEKSILIPGAAVSFNADDAIGVEFLDFLEVSTFIELQGGYSAHGNICAAVLCDGGHFFLEGVEIFISKFTAHVGYDKDLLGLGFVSRRLI